MFEMKRKMSPSAQKAKLTALKEANKMATDMMKDDIGGLKKVTIASNSPEGLKEGLEKVEEMVEGKEKDCSECPGCPHCTGEQEDEDMEMASESEDEEDMQEASEPMDIEELEQKIQELMKMKDKLRK